MGPHDRAGPRVAGCSRLSARSAGLPLRVRVVRVASLRAPELVSPQAGRSFEVVSTRKLIITALLCGVAILVAGTIFLVNASSSGLKAKADQVPAPTSTTRR